MIYNIETVSFPRHFIQRLSSRKHANHNILTIVSTPDVGQLSVKAPDKDLWHETPRAITATY